MAMQTAKFLENYNRLRAAFDDDEKAGAVSAFITSELDGQRQDLETTLATKTDISALEMRLKDRMGDTVKWVALFAIGQISAIAAIVYAIVKHA